MERDMLVNQQTARGRSYRDVMSEITAYILRVLERGILMKPWSIMAVEISMVLSGLSMLILMAAVLID